MPVWSVRCPAVVIAKNGSVEIKEFPEEMKTIGEIRQETINKNMSKMKYGF
jgi:hypothetical protein